MATAVENPMNHPSAPEMLLNSAPAIEDLLEASPSLRSELGREIARQTPRAIKLTVQDLRGCDEIDEPTADRLRHTSYTEEQVLGDWFPEE